MKKRKGKQRIIEVKLNSETKEFNKSELLENIVATTRHNVQ